MTNEEKIHIPIDVENFRDNKKLYASFIKDHKNCCGNYYQEDEYTTNPHGVQILIAEERQRPEKRKNRNT